MTAARRLGMEVTLKPHVDLRDGSFRGDIAPTDVAAWFGSYDLMVARYAQLAAQAGASTFVVGVELTTMARHETEFRRVIRTARRAFPGRLTFAANWVQGAEKVRFWDALDLVGIDAYMPLNNGPNPSVKALERAWRKRYVKRVDRLHDKLGKPILFTELGYQSRAGAARQPQGVEGPVSQVAQARAYQAAYEVWSHHSGFAGIYWWDWPGDDDPVSTAPSSFSPAGKLAERVVRRFALPRNGSR
jgi:hypothetical protein